MKRAHLRLKTKLAAALLALGDIAHEDSKAMTEDQICALYEWDHWPIRHADGGTDHPSNLTPRLIAVHREKTKRDAGERAKVRRIDAKWRTFMQAIAKGQKPPRRASRWPKRSFVRK